MKNSITDLNRNELAIYISGGFSLESAKNLAYKSAKVMLAVAFPILGLFCACGIIKLLSTNKPQPRLRRASI